MLIWGMFLADVTYVPRLSIMPSGVNSPLPRPRRLDDRELENTKRVLGHLEVLRPGGPHSLVGLVHVNI